MTTITVQLSSDKKANSLMEAFHDVEQLKLTICDAFTELAGLDIMADEQDFYEKSNIRAALWEFSKVLDLMAASTLS